MGLCASRGDPLVPEWCPKWESRDVPRVADAEEARAVLEGLQTGDLLLFHTRATSGKLMRRWTAAWADHVSVVVRQLGSVRQSPEYKVGDGYYSAPASGQLQMLDSSGRGTFPYPLLERLAKRTNMDNYIFVRKLATPAPLSDSALAACEAWVTECTGRAYESGPTGHAELARSALYRPGPGTGAKDKDDENLEMLFCSESAAETLQRLRVLSEERLNSNELLPDSFLPADVPADRAGEAERFLEGGATYGPLLMVMWPGAPLRDEVLLPLVPQVLRGAPNKPDADEGEEATIPRGMARTKA